MAQIERLNRKLRRELGEIGGRPRYQWMKSTELVFPLTDGQETVQAQSGLFVVKTRYKLAQLLPGPSRWVLALLIDPGVTEEQWGQIYGTVMEYPSKGYYFPTDVACQAGTQPDAELTDYLIAAAKDCMESSPFDIRDRLDKALAQSEADKRRKLYDEIENLVDAPDPQLGKIITYGGLGR